MSLCQYRQMRVLCPVSDNKNGLTVTELGGKRNPQSLGEGRHQGCADSYLNLKQQVAL